MRQSEPIGCGEGLCGEAAVAVEALETLDAMGLGLTEIEAGSLPPPVLRDTVVGTDGVRTERGIGESRVVAHNLSPRQDSGQTHSLKHNRFPLATGHDPL